MSNTNPSKAMKTVAAAAGVLQRGLGVPSSANVSTPRLAIQVWLDEMNRDGVPPVRGRIALLMMRNTTWIEWAAYTACWMRKLGLAPVILYKGNDVANLYDDETTSLNLTRRLWVGGFWKTVGRIPDVQLVDLDAEPQPDDAKLADYRDFADDYAHTSAAYDLRVEELEGWPRESEYEVKLDEYREKHADFAARVEGALRRVSPDGDIPRLLLYSGLIDVTAAAGEAAKRLKMDVVFVEGWAIKPGHMICNLNQPALVYNIKSWLASLGRWDEQKNQEVERFLNFQENPDETDADWLKTYHKFQRSGAADALPEHIARFIDDDRKLLLLTPNVIGDSATLRSRTIFRSQADWINQVCDFIRDRDDVKLLVRAHPDEHFLKNKVVVKMGDVAQRAAADASNILVVKGNEDVSTYALIPHAHAGLIWLSTVGVDMAVRDCPVVAAALPKYHGLGIVEQPQSRDEYFTAVDAAIDGPRTTRPAQKQMAKQYLTILAREFSYQAFGADYRGRDIHLAGHRDDGDTATFYRILAGDLPMESRPLARDGSDGSTE